MMLRVVVVQLLYTRNPADQRVMHDRVLFSFHPSQLYHMDKAMAS
jgi:hypothetical protein